MSSRLLVQNQQAAAGSLRCPADGHTLLLVVAAGGGVEPGYDNDAGAAALRFGYPAAEEEVRTVSTAFDAAGKILPTSLAMVRCNLETAWCRVHGEPRHLQTQFDRRQYMLLWF